MSEPTGPVEPRTSKRSAKPSSDAAAAAPPAAEQPPVSPPPVSPPPVSPPPAHQRRADQPVAGQPRADQPVSGIPSVTQPLPASGAVPAFSEAAPAGPPPVGPPGVPGGPGAFGPPGGRPPAGPSGPYAGVPAGPPPKGPGLWRQATSTTGGLIAVIVAAALCALLLLGAVATAGLVAVRAAGHDGNDRMGSVRDDGRQALPPREQRKLDRLPQAPGPQRRDAGPGQGGGMGGGMGNGLGGLVPGAMGLGAVQHGEFTVDQDGKAVVMTLQRGAVTKSSATSVTVKSDDGFTATYVVNDDTRGRPDALAVGDSVLVVAEKAGAKAVVVTRTRKG